MCSRSSCFRDKIHMRICTLDRHLYYTPLPRFYFNCYQHHAILVNHGAMGMWLIVSNQGVTQGDSLSMICYGIGILPLLRMLKSEFPAASSNAMQMMDQRWIFCRDPCYRCFPKSSKSILFVALHKPRLSLPAWMSSKNWFTLSRQLHR